MAAPARPPKTLLRFNFAFRVGWLAALALLLSTAHAAKWDPVNPAELADPKPRVDPEAGAEILERIVTIDHRAVDDLSIKHYVRVKLFTERGVQAFLKHNIPYPLSGEIEDVAVRTIKPDGQILELSKKDFFDREIVKFGEARVKAKSFAPAGLEPGAILEYRYTETSNGWQWWVSLFFQSEVPSRVVTYRFRPTLETYEPLTISTIFFGIPREESKKISGYDVYQMKNVPAAKQEPSQPPKLNTEYSAVVSYRLGENVPPEKYWAKRAKDADEWLREETRATGLIKSTVAALTAEIGPPEEKLRRLFDHCRTKILNRFASHRHFTREQIAKFKPNETAHDTLKSGQGSPAEMNTLFVAMARAAGFEARLALANDRSFILYSQALAQPFVLSDLIAAVRLGDEWRYFDPGAIFVPFGYAHWTNSGTAVLLSASKNGTPSMIPAPPAELSQITRKANLTLDADGTLEGTVTIDYSGHTDSVEKYRLNDLTPGEREDRVRDEVREHLKLAELKNLRIENAADPVTPLKISFHLRVPEYTERTSSRLFFQPAVFQKNLPLVYTEAKRSTDLMFQFSYIENDDIRIQPPEGYELEQASAPGDYPLGQIGSYQANVGVGKNSGRILYNRCFKWTVIRIPVKLYEPVRRAFEEIHRRDSHVLTLRRKDAALPTVEPATETTPVAGAGSPNATTTAKSE